MKPAIGIIGGGNMGAAIIAGIHEKYSLLLCEKDQDRRQDLVKKFHLQTEDLSSLVEKSQTILLAVKPQNFESVLKEVKKYLTADQVVISIAAGVTTAFIEERLGENRRVVRVMPNLAVQVGQGMTAICVGRCAKGMDLILACNIFNLIGKSVVVKEKWMDAVTALSGSGPAYVFLFVECLEKAAQALGLKEDESQLLISQTLKGSLALLEQQKEKAQVLRERVTSKGGTTQAAMDVFAEHTIEEIFREAIKAAEQRAKELAK